MEDWKFSGQRLCAEADAVLKKRRATDEECVAAVGHLLEAARQGYLGAYTRLGNCCEKGIGIAQDKTRAMEYYKQAADCGEEAAAADTLRLNPLYRARTFGQVETGNTEMEPDSRTALELYRAAMQLTANTAGSTTAADAAQNPRELFRRAACMGHPDAALRAAQFLEADGKLQEAVIWYRKAALQGSASAAEALARLDPPYDPDLPDTDWLNGEQLFELAADYRDGVNRPANEQLYERLSGLAAARNNGKASLALAWNSHKKGNFEEAAAHFTNAANVGIAEAVDMLGQMTQQGLGGLEQSDEKALKLYIKAGEMGHRGGCFHAGQCCENGIGTEINRTRAVDWYVKSAMLGDTAAADRLRELGTSGAPVAIQYRCGHFFLFGDRQGKQQDFKLAFELLQAAADAQMPEAFFDLGVMYRDGRYVYDKRKACMYLERAAQLGVTGADGERKKVYRKTIAYAREYAKTALILLICLVSSLFVVGQLNQAELIHTAAWNRPVLWLVFVAGAAGLLVKHYFLFRKFSVRPMLHNLIYTAINPGVPLGVIALLMGLGVMDVFGCALAVAVSAVLTVFLIQHDSVVRDAIWVGLRLVIFVAGAILLAQVAYAVLQAMHVSVHISAPEQFAVVVLTVSALAVMTKQYHLYSSRMEMDNFLVCALLTLVWPGIFLGGLMVFCWMVMPDHWVLAISAAVGAVLHCIISENIWGSRDTD